jgi:hypothetical protein
MRTRKNLFIMIPVVFLFLLGLSSFGGANTETELAENPNMVRPGHFVIEPPTLISLGFEWYIVGDDNRDATVNVWYRKIGDHKIGDHNEWKMALPLLRLQNEQTIFAFAANSVNYVAPNMFAGSIFDLEPDTEYECVFEMSDPDGVIGDRHHTVHVRTRAEPQPYANGNVYHCYPHGYTGTKQQPAFEGLMYAYFTGYAEADWSMVAPPRVKPGDVILVHAGVYQDDRYYYGSDLRGLGYGTPFDGTYYLTASGTPDKPIVIKAAGDGEVIFDGNGCHNLFNVMAANYNYFEGITFRNTEVVFWAGFKNLMGSSGLTVKRCRFENIGIGVWTEWSGSKNFYIADNVFIGKENSDHLMGWSGLPWSTFSDFPARYYSPYAVKVYGSGHAVCYNYVRGFHDGIDHSTYGEPDGNPNVIRDRMPVSIDFYNNDFSGMSDNCIEADGAMRNIRVFRNRCLNMAGQALSSQTIFGGPAYFIRNIVYHDRNTSGVIKHQSNPAGSIYLHNTFCAEALLAQASNNHFLNNLVLGEGDSPYIFSVDTFTNYTTSDYNGFRPNEGAQYSFRWTSPPFNIMVDYVNPRVTRNFATLQAYQQGTGQDEHSILIDWNIFVNVAKPDFNNPTRLYNAQDLDFRLKPDAVAVDAGAILHNVNDDFTGKAPDLGALEVGQPVPIYGPRP